MKGTASDCNPHEQQIQPENGVFNTSVNMGNRWDVLMCSLNFETAMACAQQIDRRYKKNIRPQKLQVSAASKVLQPAWGICATCHRDRNNPTFSTTNVSWIAKFNKNMAKLMIDHMN